MRKLIAILFYASLIFSGEEINVSLSTKNYVYPVYLSQVSKENPDIDVGYVDKIRGVLEYDLMTSGYISLVNTEKSKEKVLSNADFKVSFDPSFWRGQKVRLAIKLIAVEGMVNVFIYDSTQEEYSYLSSVSLSGDLNIDRRKIHIIADEILSTYLGKMGISQSTIIFTLRRDNPDKRGIPWISEVWSCDCDGENRHQITYDNNYNVTPAYMALPMQKSKGIPNFLYVSYKKGIPKIYINTEAKEGALVQLRGNQLLPSISPQLDKVAFISDAAGRPDLFLQRLDSEYNPVGKPWQLFSMPKATQATSAFSPDGEKLAFVSDKDGTPRIYVIKIPDAGFSRLRPYAHLITRKNRYNVTPSWSNDGTKLAYSAKVGGIRQIWMYDFIEDEETQLTFGGENKENACWASDNFHIVYNTEDKKVSELYIINLNNTKPVKILSGVGQKRFPSWER